MIPVVTPAQMTAIDAAAPETVDELVARAGAAVARVAREMLGGHYGRRVVVIAGPGNNGRDGEVAAELLARRGAAVGIVAATDPPARLAPCDLVIDAAFGTGLARPWHPPHLAPGTPVLAVDTPSGVDGLTGDAAGSPLAADVTVTFAALKPGLLFGAGRSLSGEVRVADIGLDVGGADTHLIELADVAAGWPRRAVDTHKWRSACWVVGGSPNMTGAAYMAAAAAARSGAGYVRLSVPGLEAPGGPVEAVGHPLDEGEWAPEVLAGLDRFAALVIGPGLGSGRHDAEAVRRAVADAPVPVVVDGDGLGALGDKALTVLAGRSAATVLTPHDAEFARLTGHAPGDDRIAAARRLASETGAHVLLKGPTTVVAAPGGAVRLSVAGDSRLATAGTGDVLSGMIGGLLAAGADALTAASLAAVVHGHAATMGPSSGLIASDLPGLVALVLDELVPAPRGVHVERI
ncbi:MAG: NAD(P)H-hydrate dehydratase [Acidimicrobiales bacterium]